MELLTIITACNDSKHDWWHTQSHLEAALSVMRQALPAVTSIYLASDNANNYHGTAPLIATYVLAKASRLRILQVNYCEPGEGKDICDETFSHLGVHAERYIAEGGSMRVAAEVVAGFSEVVFSEVVSWRPAWPHREGGAGGQG